MLRLRKPGSRTTDVLAVAAVVGAFVGFIVFVALAPLPTEIEWQRLIGATMIAKAAAPGTTDVPSAFPDATAQPASAML